MGVVGGHPSLDTSESARPHQGRLPAFRLGVGSDDPGFLPGVVVHSLATELGIAPPSLTVGDFLRSP